MNDTDRAQALADRVWEELLEREPTFATAIGDERYDDRLPDIGEQGRAASETHNRAALDELATIDRGSLEASSSSAARLRVSDAARPCSPMSGSRSS